MIWCHILSLSLSLSLSLYLSISLFENIFLKIRVPLYSKRLIQLFASLFIPFYSLNDLMITMYRCWGKTQRKCVDTTRPVTLPCPFPPLFLSVSLCLSFSLSPLSFSLCFCISLCYWISLSFILSISILKFSIPVSLSLSLCLSLCYYLPHICYLSDLALSLVSVINVVYPKSNITFHLHFSFDSFLLHTSSLLSTLLLYILPVYSLLFYFT